jgi:lipoate-protein ligase B
VTWHGFALNVSTDLRWFDLIVACGIPGVTMTSVARELAVIRPEMPEVMERVVAAMTEVFRFDGTVWIPVEELVVRTGTGVNRADTGPADHGRLPR